LWQNFIGNPILPDCRNTAGSSGERLSLFAIGESGVVEVINHEGFRTLANFVVVISTAVVQAWR
jgi:hypothetical protein